MATRRFNPELYPGGRRVFSRWSDPITHPETGETIQRTGDIRLVKKGKRLKGRFIYKVAKPDSKERIDM